MADDMPAKLDALSAAVSACSAALESWPLRVEALADTILNEGNRQRRARFLRCSGCEECSAPLPVLTGDVR